MSEREECCEKHERGRRCGDCPHDDRLVDHLGGNPALREELLGRLTSLRARVARKRQAYEQGYADGESSVSADYWVALTDAKLLPEDAEVTPSVVVAMVRRAVEEEREWILAAVRQLGQTGAISLHAAHRVADTIRRRGA